VVVIAEDAMSTGDVTEVPRRELPITDLAATSMSVDGSNVSRASVSTASGTARVPATGAATPRMPTASTHAPVFRAERDAALQGERENDRDTKGEEGTPERVQRRLDRGKLHGGSVAASSGRVKRVRLHPPRWEIMFNLVAGGRWAS